MKRVKQGELSTSEERVTDDQLPKKVERVRWDELTKVAERAKKGELSKDGERVIHPKLPKVAERARSRKLPKLPERVKAYELFTERERVTEAEFPTIPKRAMFGKLPSRQKRAIRGGMSMACERCNEKFRLTSMQHIMGEFPAEICAPCGRAWDRLIRSHELWADVIACEAAAQEAMGCRHTKEYFRASTLAYWAEERNRVILQAHDLFEEFCAARKGEKQ